MYLLYYCIKLEKMQCQVPATSQPLALNPLNNMVQVDELDYSADFDNVYLRMDNFDNFFKTRKIL